MPHPPTADQVRLSHILADDLQDRIDYFYALEQAVAVLGGTTIHSGNGDPNGLVTAAEGDIFLDRTTPAVWQNTDGATAWTQLGTGGAGVTSVNGDAGPNVILVASEIGSTATGDVAATDVQAAIAELASEKATVTALAAEATLARNADNLTSGTVADARIASTIARDSEVTSAVAAEATLARNADNLSSGTVADARIASTIARDSEVTSAVAAEAALARNADNLTSGTVLDARIDAAIARDSEVTSAVAAEAALARNADNLTSGTVADARIASTIARDSEVTSAVAAEATARDAAIAAALAGLDVKPDVAYASTSALPANTYANGSSGVGATLTGNVNGPLIIDGVTLAIGQAGERVLVCAEAAPANNGWYVITQVGVIAVSPYILTRATESDQAAEIGAGYLTGVVAPNGVTAGTNNGKLYISVAADPFTVGTTALTFSQVGSTYSAGTGLGLSGTTFSIDTGVTVDKTTAQTLTTKTLTSPVLNTGVSGTAVDTDATMTANSDTLLASQKAIKTALATLQPLNTNLTALGGVTSAADKVPYFTGAGAAAVATFTAFGRAQVAISTLAANGVLYGAGAGAIGATAVGTAGHVLTSNGTGSAPTFQAVAVSTTGTDLSLSGNLAVSGTTTLASLGVAGLATAASMTISGATILNTLAASGAATVGGTLGVTGATTIGAPYYASGSVNSSGSISVENAFLGLCFVGSQFSSVASTIDLRCIGGTIAAGTTGLASGTVIGGMHIGASIDTVAANGDPVLWDLAQIYNVATEDFSRGQSTLVSLTGVSSDVSADTLTSTAHGLSNGDKVAVAGFTNTTGLTLGTYYFVVNKTANTFQLSTTLGGSAINLTGSNDTGLFVSNTCVGSKWQFWTAPNGSNNKRVVVEFGQAGNIIGNYGANIAGTTVLTTVGILGNTTMTGTLDVTGATTLTSTTITPTTGGGLSLAVVNGVAGIPGFQFVRINGTAGSPTKVVSGNTISVLNFAGQYDTTVGHNKIGAAIYGVATQDYSSADFGTKLVLYTSDNTSSTLTPALTLDQDQSATFAGAVSGITTLAATGIASFGSAAQLTISAAGTVSTTGNLATTGSGTLSIAGAASLLSTLAVTGATTLADVTIVPTTGFGTSLATVNGIAGSPGFSFQRINGTAVSPTKVVSGNVVAYLTMGGQYDTTVGHTKIGAGIQAVATQDYGAADFGTKLVLYTSDNTSSTLTTALTIDQDQSLLATNSIKSSHATAGIGYATGAGGAATQATSRTTGVTIDAVCGAITLFAAVLNSGITTSFLFTNSAIAATDVILLSIKSGATTNTYVVGVEAVSAGSCRILIRNISASNSPSEAPVISFAVFKGATS